MNNTNNEFHAFGLSSAILKAVTELGFKSPTPIQAEAIPAILGGHDLMGLAQTGTGKTAAFGLPLVQQLIGRNEKPAPKSVAALVLAPTRELVNQIAENLRRYVRHTHLRVNSVVGGVSINAQRQKLLRGTDILIATPGRLLDHVERRTVDLSGVKFFILDEADMMLDLGFIHTLRRLEKMIGKDRQTMLFSATMPKQIEALSQSFQSNPVRIEVTSPGRAADKVRQSVHFVETHHKLALLKSCLSQRPQDISMVFSRTKHGAEKLKKALVAHGLPADAIHGNKSQGQRERTLAAFRRGDVRILVATDVAARGIDIPGVTHVYNFDLPEVAESYVHRIGRTARAGAEGEAVAFCSPDTVGLLKSIEKLMGTPIDVASGERMLELAANSNPRRQQQRKRTSSGGQSQKGRTDQRAATGNGSRNSLDKTKNTRQRPDRAGTDGDTFQLDRAARKNRQRRRNRNKSVAA